MPSSRMTAGALERRSTTSGVARPVISGTLGPELAPSVRADQVVWLRWVDERTIPVDHRCFVRWHVNLIARSLALEAPIYVRWLAPMAPWEAKPAGPFLDVLADAWLRFGREVLPFLSTGPGELPAGVTLPPWLAPRTIALNASLRGEQLLIGVIAHEVRHVGQDELRMRLEDPGECERDAERFAAAYVAQEVS